MFEKVKEWFKKNKSYIITIGGIITALLGINYFRNRAIKRNLERVNSQLSESDKLLEQLESDNRELRAELEKSRNIIYELEQEFERSNNEVRELERINIGLERESSNIESGLEKLRKFIDENSSRE